MAYTQLNPRHTIGARVEEISRKSVHYRLSIPSGVSDSYRLAQLDDYTKTPRGRFHHRVPLSPSTSLRTSLSLSARASSDAIAGTWGFGLWNDPFGLSLGFGGSPLRLPALPNAVWFFGASKENYLSFKNTIGQGDPASTNPANGFLAQTFRSPKFHPWLILAGLALPFSRKLTRRSLSRVIEEDGVVLSVDPTQWHRYRLDWSLKRVTFEVDEVLVFESPVSPNPLLGLVIWIDNQYAAFTPEGKIRFGVLANTEPAWLEVKEIDLKSL
jgi:hypothetical protein